MTDDKEQLEARLAEYIDGTLGPVETRELEAHLDADPELRAAVTRLMLDSEALRLLPNVSSPVDFSEDYRAHLERDLLLGGVGEPAGRPRRFAVPFASIAAMLVIGLGMGTVAYWLVVMRPSAPFSEVAIHAPEAEPTVAEAGVPTAVVARETAALPTDVARGDHARFEDVRPPDLEAPAQAGPVASRDSATPGIAAAEPQLQLDAAPLPELVAAELYPHLTPGRPVIVFYADLPTAVAAASIDQRVGTLLELRAVGDARGMNDLERRAAEPNRDAAAGRHETVVDADLAYANTFSRKGTPSIRVARSQTQTAAARLQRELQTLPDMPTFAGYLISGEVVAAHQKDKESKAVGLFDPPPEDEPSATAPTTAPAARRLERGERLRVVLVDPDAFNLRTEESVTIDDAGAISLPSLDDVAAADRSLAQLRDEIMQAYQTRGGMRNPRVEVRSLDHPDDPPALPVEPVEMRQQSGIFVPVESDRAAAADEGMFDVYIIVNRPAATTQPVAEPAIQPTIDPTTEPTSQPATQPS